MSGFMVKGHIRIEGYIQRELIRLMLRFCPLKIGMITSIMLLMRLLIS